MNKRRELVIGLGVGAVVAPLGSFAQQPSRVRRVGVLETTSTNSVFLPAFRKGLRDLGYVEGENLVIAYRSADGRLERLAELATELVAAKVDVIVTRATNASLAAKNATGVIPVVAVQVGSPGRKRAREVPLASRRQRDGAEFCLLRVVREARRAPQGGDSCGQANRCPHESGQSRCRKCLEADRIGRAGPGRRAAGFDVRKADDLAHAFDVAGKQGVGALVVVGGSLMQPNREIIVALGRKHRLATMYPGREFVDAGGFDVLRCRLPPDCSIAQRVSFTGFSRAQGQPILVEQPTNFELVINLKTAEALLLTIPTSLLLRADEVLQ